MNIGEQIQSIRKKNGLSQDGFAELFNISRQTVSNWENGVSQTKGYSGITCVYLLAKILNIREQYLKYSVFPMCYKFYLIV